MIPSLRSGQDDIALWGAAFRARLIEREKTLEFGGKLPYNFKSVECEEGSPMPAVATKKDPVRDARLEARVSRETKILWERAAAVQGRKVTEFVVSSAVEAAQRVLRESELSALTRRDRIAFVEALLNPPAPNLKLQRAAARHA